MRKKKTEVLKYPGTEEAEKQRKKTSVHFFPGPPDFIGGKPNYKEFDRYGWTAEKTLRWLNID